jgi:hypothetical protein
LFGYTRQPGAGKDKYAPAKNFFKEVISHPHKTFKKYHSPRFASLRIAASFLSRSAPISLAQLMAFFKMLNHHIKKILLS